MTSEYKVTNVRLPAELLRELKLHAAGEGKSVAQLIRESIIIYLGTYDRSKKEDAFAEDPFFSLGASGDSGLEDGSIAHDRYLYPDGPGNRGD